MKRLFLGFLLLEIFPTWGTQCTQNIRGNVIHENLWFADPYLDDRWNTSLGSSDICQKFKHLLPVLRGTRGAITIPLVSHGTETQPIPNLLAVIQDCHSHYQPFIFTLLYDGKSFFILTDEENSYPCNECVELGRYALYPSDLRNPLLQRIPPDYTPVPIFYTNVLRFYPVILIPLAPYYAQYYPSLPTYPQNPSEVSQYPASIGANFAKSSSTEEPMPTITPLLSALPTTNETPETAAATPVFPAISYATITTSSAMLSAPLESQQKCTFSTADRRHHAQEKAFHSRMPTVVQLPKRSPATIFPSPSPSLTVSSEFSESNLSEKVKEISKQDAGAVALSTLSRNQRKKDKKKAKEENFIVPIVQATASLSPSTPPLIARPVFGPDHPRILQRNPVERTVRSLVEKVLKDIHITLKNRTEEEQHAQAVTHFKSDNIQAALACYEQLDLNALLARSFEDCLILMQIFLALPQEQWSAHTTTEKLVRRKAKAFFSLPQRTIHGSQLQLLCRFLIKNEQDPQYFEYVQAGTKCGEIECTYLSLKREIERTIQNPTLCENTPSEECPHQTALTFIDTHKYAFSTSLTAMHLFIYAHLTPCPYKNSDQPSAILVEKVLRIAKEKKIFSAEKLKSLFALQVELSPKDETGIVPDQCFTTPLENIIAGRTLWNKSQIAGSTANDIILAKTYFKQAQTQLDIKTATGVEHNLHERIMLLYILLHTKQEFYLPQSDIDFLQTFVFSSEQRQDETDTTMQGLACFALAFHYLKVRHLDSLANTEFYERALKKGLELKNPDCIMLEIHQRRKRSNITSGQTNPNKMTSLNPDQPQKCVILLSSKRLTKTESEEIFRDCIIRPLQRSIMGFKSDILIQSKKEQLLVLEKILPKIARVSLINLLRDLREANPRPEEYLLLLETLYKRSQHAGTDLTREQKEALAHCIKILSSEFIAPPGLTAKQPKEFIRAQENFLVTMKAIKLPSAKQKLSGEEIVTQTQSLF